VVDVPPSYSTRTVEFISEMESLTVDADRPAKIVINERTGTIVMGKDVKITPVAIMHGALSVEIRTKLEVSQPPPLSGGQTKVVPQTSVTAQDSKAKALVLQKGRNGGGTGAGAASHRLHAPRCVGDSTSHAIGRRTGCGNRGDLMTVSAMTPATLNTAAPTKVEGAAKQFEALMIAQMLRTARENTEDQDSSGRPCSTWPTSSFRRCWPTMAD